MRHFYTLTLCLLLCFTDVAHAQSLPELKDQVMKAGTSLMYHITPKNGAQAYDLVVTFKQVDNELYFLHMNMSNTKQWGSVRMKAADVATGQNIGLRLENGNAVLLHQCAVLVGKDFASQFSQGADMAYNGLTYSPTDAPLKLNVRIDDKSTSVTLPAVQANGAEGPVLAVLPWQPYAVWAVYEDAEIKAELIRIAAK